VTAFTGARLDRAGDDRRRDPAWLAEQRAHPAARAVLAGDAGVVMDGDRLARVPLAEALRAGGEPLLLGVDEDGPLYVIDVDAPAEAEAGPPPLIAAGGARRPPPDGAPRQVPLRQAVAVLPQDEGGLVAYVASLCNWHRRHRFCSACGAPSDIGEGGLVRACPRCGTTHHPRTDPVVIMLVTDADRVLLGRAPSWPERRYSALAGYVEPGESLEEAVAREVAEESGVEVGAPRYVESQPWPFPSSLMLGFDAPHRSGEPHAREADVEDVRWFSRAEIAAAAHVESDDWTAPATPAPLLLPPRLAIARRLIERWLAA
jgi:NAD+ diphosphatase